MLQRSTPGQLQLLGEIKREKNQKSGLPRRTTGPKKVMISESLYSCLKDTSGAFQITRVGVDTWPRGWCLPALWTPRLWKIMASFLLPKNLGNNITDSGLGKIMYVCKNPYIMLAEYIAKISNALHISRIKMELHHTYRSYKEEGPNWGQKWWLPDTLWEQQGNTRLNWIYLSVWRTQQLNYMWNFSWNPNVLFSMDVISTGVDAEVQELCNHWVISRGQVFTTLNRRYRWVPCFLVLRGRQKSNELF